MTRTSVAWYPSTATMTTTHPAARSEALSAGMFCRAHTPWRAVRWWFVIGLSMCRRCTCSTRTVQTLIRIGRTWRSKHRPAGLASISAIFTNVVQWRKSAPSPWACCPSLTQSCRAFFLHRRSSRKVPSSSPAVIWNNACTQRKTTTARAGAGWVSARQLLQQRHRQRGLSRLLPLVATPSAAIGSGRSICTRRGTTTGMGVGMYTRG
mmetsp:Transcript_67040/g.112215  ORF Transcript_67040/g.112215 Transcript_67040/m.112215 type:complete len:208 (-) Transcript_67040:870-1493(-)